MRSSKEAMCGSTVTARSLPDGAVPKHSPRRPGLPYCRRMIDHFGINCNDLERSAAFYDRVLAVLCHTRLMDYGVAIGYGSDAKPQFWISRWEGTEPNREIHVGFEAASTEAVLAFHAA